MKLGKRAAKLNVKPEQNATARRNDRIFQEINKGRFRASRKLSDRDLYRQKASDSLRSLEGWCS